MKKENGMLNIKVFARECIVYEIEYKKGQKEFLKKIAEANGVTFDELVSRKVAEATGEDIFPMPRKIRSIK